MIDCCKSPDPRPAGGYWFLAKAFRSKGVEDFHLFRCESCGEYRLDIDTSDQKTHSVPIPAARGDHLREETRKFHNNIDRWMRDN